MIALPLSLIPDILPSVPTRPDPPPKAKTKGRKGGAKKEDDVVGADLLPVVPLDDGPEEASTVVEEDTVETVPEALDDEDKEEDEDPTGDEMVVTVVKDPRELERTMTLRQLRDQCAERGLATNGKKSELAARLAQD